MVIGFGGLKCVCVILIMVKFSVRFLRGGTGVSVALLPFGGGEHDAALEIDHAVLVFELYGASAPGSVVVRQIQGPAVTVAGAVNTSTPNIKHQSRMCMPPP